MCDNFISYIDEFIARIDLPLKSRNEIINAEKIIFANHDVLEIFTKSKHEYMENRISLDEALKLTESLSKNMVFVCHSWLLYKGLEKILPADSRILDFIHDFDIISSNESEEFDDSWRIFGKHYKMPIEQWPKDTKLRKAVGDC